MNDDLGSLLARANAVLQEARRLTDEFRWQRRLALRQAALLSEIRQADGLACWLLVAEPDRIIKRE